MEHSFFSAFVLLVMIMDPLGNIPVFAGAMQHIEAGRRKAIIAREHLIAFGTLLAFMLFGKSFLQALGLSNASLQISGGVILLIIALRMVFPAAPNHEERSAAEPFIVPLAIPAIAGPSALATVMLLANQQPDKLPQWVGALACAVVLSIAILLAAEQLKDKIGPRVVAAIERLMGLILVAISVEMLLRGARLLLREGAV